MFNIITSLSFQHWTIKYYYLLEYNPQTEQIVVRKLIVDAADELIHPACNKLKYVQQITSRHKYLCLIPCN